MKAGIIVLLAALPILASARAVAADLRFGKPEAIAPVAITTTVRGRVVHAHARLRESRADELFSPLAEGAFALDDDGSDDASPPRPSVRFYPIANSDAPDGAAAPTAPSSSAKGGGEAPRRAKQAALPEPGSWAMILAGLLGVGAIARRRMSA